MMARAPTRLPVKVAAPSGAYAGTSREPLEIGQQVKVSAEVSTIVDALNGYEPALVTRGAGGGAGGAAAPAASIFTSTHPPQSRWSSTEIVQSLAVAVAGRVHVIEYPPGTMALGAATPFAPYGAVWPAAVAVHAFAAAVSIVAPSMVACDGAPHAKT